MELTNDFRVNVPVDEAWAVLTDVERIAPCMPGAQLTEVEGDEYRGNVKVKVGPITAQYKGTARFVEKDEAGHRAVLEASGRDTRGQGNASATVTATLTADGNSTAVTVVTDLTVTGKVAQFGRGVLADVSSKLIGQFVDCLETDVLAGSGGNPADGPATAIDALPSASAAAPGADGGAAGNGAAAPASPDSEGIRTIVPREVAAVDLLGTAGSSVAKRVAPIIGVFVVILWLLRRRRR
ncbi:MAG TPA: SRPBCC family protein [Acidimicrobiales bacterium]|nr:SRPBCC family protein [Acidimicrobiales bacterium]